MLALIWALWYALYLRPTSDYPVETENTCPQAPALFPNEHADLDSRLEVLYAWDGFKGDAYNKLGGAVRIPTESYDDLKPVGQDARWDTFQKLHDYLEFAFPLVYRKLEVTRVNTYALVFHWQGSDETLKPVLLTAHQDVVPVEPSTVDQWEHPPYSGYYDGEWIWGRGSADDKSSLTSQLIAVDTLLKNGFTPSRTVVLAYGIDEEAAGTEGAGHLRKYLETRYGRYAFAILVDEGDGYVHLAGGDVILAMPDVSEKGYLDVRIEINTKGGHSSVPPVHTSIGILSAMIVEIEKTPQKPKMLRNGTTFAFTQCVASHDPSFPDKLRKLVKKAINDDDALEQLKEGLIKDPQYRAALGTTQAVDLISGGVKVNALPEKAEAVVNHRIAEHSSVRELRDHIISVLIPVAEAYNLTVKAFGQDYLSDTGTSAGELVLSDAFDSALEPSPVTPTGTSGPSQLLSGTIKATIETSKGYNATGVVVAPGFAVGNTDTQFYWNLTKHIFRYSHLGDTSVKGIHTVNEAVRAESIVEYVRFITKLILNADESALL